MFRDDAYVNAQELQSLKFMIEWFVVYSIWMNMELEYLNIDVKMY